MFVGVSGVCGGEGLAFVGFEFENCEDRGGIEVVKRRLERCNNACLRHREQTYLRFVSFNF